MPGIGFIILAAGSSTRLGSPKQLLLNRHKSFLRHISEVALASKCKPVIVVLGAYAYLFIPEIEQLPVEIVENPQWSLGIGTSIKAGIAALIASGADVESVIISVCDQPFVCSQVIEGIINAYVLTKKPIVASQYEGTLGVPALFDKILFPQLMALKPESGAKQIIQKYPLEVCSVLFPLGAIDVDTPAHYEELLKLLKEYY